MKIAIAQINPTVGDLNGNALKIASYLGQAQVARADLVIFPELAICGYPPEDLLYKENFVRDNLRALDSLKPQSADLTAVIGFVDRGPKGELYNAAAILNNGKLKAVCHKQELPNYGVFDEKRYFSTGKNDVVFALGPVTFGINICEDIWKHDGLYLQQAKQGARLLVNLSASPYHEGKLKVRQQMLAQRAKTAKSFIVYANLVGGQDELVFDGASLVLSPQGKVLARGRQFAEDLLVVDVPLNRKQKLLGKKVVRLGEPAKDVVETKSAFHLVKPLNLIEEVYEALVLGTRDYVVKNGFKKVVVGLSGGIDSSLVAAIAVDAIGKENVIGVTMPSRFSSSGTKTDAKILADNLGIQFLEIPIEKLMQSYTQALQESFAGTKPNVAEENVQARIRGNLLMALSNKFGWLVLTTGNKSEIAVGYCTLYGDMSGGFAIIKDVPKTKVYALSRFRNDKAGKALIPESVFTRPPTAELRDNQTDQDTLPPYDILDIILKSYVEDHRSPLRIAGPKGDQSLVKRVIRMVDISEYKRRQAAPGIKITPRAFGKDWRLPITNKYVGF